MVLIRTSACRYSPRKQCMTLCPTFYLHRSAASAWLWTINFAQLISMRIIRTIRMYFDFYLCERMTRNRYVHVISRKLEIIANRLERVSSGTIRKFEWILRQFKEETRRLSSAKSSFVTQKWRSDARNCGLRNF